MKTRSARTVLSVALPLALLGGACGETSDDKPSASASTTAPGVTAPGANTLAVTGIDYAFTGVPATTTAGTNVTFTNASKTEFHELVALRVKDGENRPVAELLALPEAERDQAAEFRGVILAFPGEAGFTPEGPVVLAQPGRYLFVCTIPVGADPNAFREAFKTPGGPPPSVAGGPPHVARGMITELNVT